MKIDDDHYVHDPNNARIDLAWFEKELGRIAESRSTDEPDKEVLQKLCDHAILRINKEPAEPDDDQLICRYLTPLKYLWFISSKVLRFTNAGRVEDLHECSLPSDYDIAVSKVLHKYNLPANQWYNQLRKKKEKWLISCWTALDKYHDDYLIWYRYAGGPTGIGITIRYDKLKEHLRQHVDQIEQNHSLISGKVSYESPFRTLPFNKRAMFRNEKEVRFAFRQLSFLHGQDVDVGDIFQYFELRFSPDAPEHHSDAVRSFWRRCGGQDRFQSPDA